MAVGRCRDCAIFVSPEKEVTFGGGVFCLLVCYKKLVVGLWAVGAKEQPVYGGGRYDKNIYFLKYCCLVKTGYCLVKKGCCLVKKDCSLVKKGCCLVKTS